MSPCLLCSKTYCSDEFIPLAPQCTLMQMGGEFNCFDLPSPCVTLQAVVNVVTR